MNLVGKRVMVTGGAGFLGRYVVQALQSRGCRDVLVPRREEYDLRRRENVVRVFADLRPDAVIHLAARVGGIGANRAYPGSFFYDNLMMGILMMEQARLLGIEKFVAIGTICAYPKYAPVPFREEDLWKGYPEETNAPYGLAKKMLLVQAQAYRQQYGFNAIYLLPTNLYGPGDTYDPERSHVIPALIKKLFDAVESGQTEITVWGDGSPTREFLYVEDCADGIVLATERYDQPDPVNLGSRDEVSIRDLVGLLAELIGFQGLILWDTSMPNGQPRRRVDSTRAAQAFGFRARTSLWEGLRRTIDWYREQRQGVRVVGISLPEAEVDETLAVPNHDYHALLQPGPIH